MSQIIWSFTVRINNVYLSDDTTAAGDLCKVTIPDIQNFTFDKTGKTYIAVGHRAVTQLSSLKSKSLTLQFEFMTATLFNALRTMIDSHAETGINMEIEITGELAGQVWQFDVDPNWPPIQWQTLSGDLYEKVQINLLRAED